MAKPKDDNVRPARSQDDAVLGIPPEGWQYLTDRYGWSQREAEIAPRLAAGVADKHMARDFGISVETVHTHVKDLYRKTRIHGRARFAAKIRACYDRHLRGEDERSDPPPELNFCSSPELGMVIPFFSGSL
jgi:DNA-binding CsgD family transcriptional regulator